jgi:hypothetical protein
VALPLGQQRPTHRTSSVHARASATVLLGGNAPEGLLWPDGELPPELLADLCDPRLVISADYVGRDRRRPGPVAQRCPSGHRPSSRVRQAIVVMVATTAAVVPLTLIASRAPVQAPLQASVSRSAATAFPAGLARLQRAYTRRPARGPAQSAHVKAAVGRSARAVGAVPAMGRRAVAAAPTTCAGTSETLSPAKCVRLQAAEHRRALRSARRAARMKRRGPPRGTGTRIARPGP